MIQTTTLPTLDNPSKVKIAPVASTPLLRPNLEDRHLAERVERALRARGYWTLFAVRVLVDARVVILEGKVGSFFLKQLAQETALAVPGAHQIRNELDVV